MSDQANIIVILADDMGYGDAGCYGSSQIRTPRLDAMATAGMRFTDFHSNGAVCSPTRAALLTGRYQQRCGIEGVITAKRHRDVGMPLEETTVAKILRANGYRTGIFGKWHLGYDRRYNPVHFGFDEFRGFVSGNVDYRSHIDGAGFEDWWENDVLAPEDGYTTELITEHGIRFIEQNREPPFFLYLPHACPHYPYQGPDDPGYRTSGNPGPNFGPREDPDAAYVEMMESMDEGIGRIVDRVKQLGLAEQTLIFFFSDNGPAGLGSSGGLRGGKGTLWEGGHRVPAIAYRPGTITPGRVTDETTIGIDLFPTILSVAGVPLTAKPNLDGIDLVPMMADGSPLPERTLYWRHADQRAVREGSWKLLVTDTGIGLYDLDDDIGEERNLVGAQPKIVERLKKRLEAWEVEVTDGVDRLT